MADYYIASCMFTARFPETSLTIQNYIKTRPDIKTVRCCIPRYRVDFNTNRISVPHVRSAWEQLLVSEVFQPGDTVISVCHNCTNIVDEWRTGVNVVSLWEFIDSDPAFPFPDHSGLEVTIQDCWRTRERRQEQDAVRSLLKKMNIRYVEAEKIMKRQTFAAARYTGLSPLKIRSLPQSTISNRRKGSFRTILRKNRAQ